MLSIFKKELQAFFSSVTGYIVIGIFLLAVGLFLWVIPGQFNIPDVGYANVDGLFYLAPQLFLFLCPAVSMRLFAEEKQTETWELLVAKPLSEWQIVLGKYFAATIVILLAVLPTVIYFFSVSHLAEPRGNVDTGQFWGSFIGLIFLASVYMAAGTFASSLSKNQITAFVTALILCFFLYYGFDLLASFFTSGTKIHFIENLGIHAHYKSMARGVVDSRDTVYFVAVDTIFLTLTARRVKRMQ